MKTISEDKFEQFLIENNLHFKKVRENNSPKPDYLVRAGELELAFEVKELTEDENFKTGPFAVSSRIVGEHVRKKIHDAKKQIQFAAHQGIPSILLIYNNLDPLNLFGTENHDFIAAMYGEYTVVLKKSTGEALDSFHGQNQSLSAGKNTSFSAIGRLSPYLGKMKVTLFENAFSKVKIPYDKLPQCFELINVQIEYV